MGENNYLQALSQEHGIIRMDSEFFSQVEIGGLVYIIPVHVCLAVHALNAEFMIISENGD